MTGEKRGRTPGVETTDIGAPGAPVRERHLTARRKQEAVLRVLRGEPLEMVARELRVTAGDLSRRRHARGAGQGLTAYDDSPL